MAAAQTKAEEARLFRFPATNGTEVVFSYAGDLYTAPLGGGEARRLTSHVGYEMFPKYSPDGRTIAFTGQYDGNTEVYSVPADGGEPLRLTYTATNQRDNLGDRMGPNNIVMGWTPDGKQIIYRNRISDGFAGKLNLVSSYGGLSEAMPLPEGGFCSYSPDGKKLAYNRVMREFRTWKYYTGGMADDVWIYDPQAGTVTNVTENKAQDIFPMWIGDEIYFISDRDRTMNLFVYDTRTKQTNKVTNFTDYDIKFPSSHGEWIVFENGGYIYKLNAETKKAEKLTISLSSDNIYARSETKDGSKYVNTLSLSPDGNRAAVTARGEVFSVPVKKGVTKNITRTPGAHDRDGEWSPDGKSIAYISDGTGETEIYVQNVETGESTQLTKNNDTYIRSFTWSPDSKTIVYTDRENRINEVTVASKAVRTLLQAPLSEPRGVAFSPDSKWITYSRTADNEVDIVYVMNLADKKEYAVTDKWYDSGSPSFSKDGRYIVLSSSRDFNPTYGWKEWNHVYTNTQGVYLALLSKDTPSPFLTKDPDIKKAEDKPAADGTVTVRIDTDGLSDRIVSLNVQPSYYSSLYSDGSRVYYNRSGASYVYDLDEQEETKIADASIFVDTNAGKAIFMKAGKFYVAEVPKGATTLDDAIDLSNMKIATDYPQEWAQIFDEAWRAFRDGFYVTNMHGVDWTAMKKKYEVLLPYVKNRMDLNYVIGEMIGELNVGHSYISPGEMPSAQRVPMGLLGAEVSRDKSGFFRIEKILKGESWSEDLRSPLTDAGIDAKVGDYIVSIDGVATDSVNDMYKLLVGKADVATEIMLNSKPQLAGARRVVITPIGNEYPLYRYEWVQNNLKKVEEASGGKIGYIYVPDMGPDGLNEFSRYFYPQLDKEALIIDDRANGGGNVSPMLLERLAREPYRLTMRRGSSRIGTVPDGLQYGPKVCLINKYSASDGDLFPWGFRALGLGKLIGTRTWGGIVGISNTLPFMDGTDIRVPFFTSYDAKTGEWIIENHGVDPDILIDNDPIREHNGEDQQLMRAVEELMKDLKDREPLKPVPAPRVWNK